MLCTKIRLKERRLEQQQQRLLLHDAINEGPVVRRPCLIKNLLAADCITATTSTNNTTTNTTTVMIATTNATSITPTTTTPPTATTTTLPPSTTTITSSNDSANNKQRNLLQQQQQQQPPNKTPLIMLTLSMSPETETLAPRNIKRDPRKQPSFCLNFKSVISSNNMNSIDRQQQSTVAGTQEDSLNFLIKGVEICEQQHKNNNKTDEIAKNNQNTAATDVDVTLDNDIKVIECTCDNEHKVIHDFMLNLDEYEMDTFGHLPGDSRTPTPSRAVSGTCRGGGSLTATGAQFNVNGTGLRSPNDSAYWLRGGNNSCRLQKQPNSPQTEQVIRITMNKK